MKTAKQINTAYLSYMMKGCKITHHSTWYGNWTTLKIESVSQTEDGRELLFVGTDSTGRHDRIGMWAELLADLLLKQKAEEHRDIERCDVADTWTITIPESTIAGALLGAKA